jgi:hypothetical protein
MRYLILFFLSSLLMSWIFPLQAQLYLSVENERRMIRKKAFVGEEIRFCLGNERTKISGTIDSLALDGVFSVGGTLYKSSEIRKIYAVGSLRVNDRGKRLLGGTLAASSMVYMAGTLINGWIIGPPANQIRYYQVPLIIFAGGIALLTPWRTAYPLERRWKLRVLQM